MYKVLLVEDHILVRSGLKLLFNSHADINVIGEVDNGMQALEYLRNNELPDLILTDFTMPEMDGIALITKVKIMFPDVIIAVLSMVDDHATVLEAFKAGALGYLSKNSDYNELLSGLLEICQGKRYLSTSIGLSLLDNWHINQPVRLDKEIICQRYDITERELNVLELITHGLTNAEIADKIFLSKRTVEGVRQQLIDKTNTKNTADLVRFAFQKSLIQ